MLILPKQTLQVRMFNATASLPSATMDNLKDLDIFSHTTYARTLVVGEEEMLAHNYRVNKVIQGGPPLPSHN